MNTEVRLSSLIPPAPQCVWHHTSAAGLIGMIQSAEFWASNPMSMNDSSEINYARQLITERMKHLDFQGGTNTRFAALLSLDRSVPLQSFMICATTIEDSLNQWMHYSGDGGYAVGVDTRQRLDPVGGIPDFASVTSFLVPGWYSVVYDRSAQVKLVDNVLHTLMTEAKTLMPASFAPHRDWRALLGTLQLVLKHPSFAAESEVRYLAVGDTSKSGNVHFRPGPRGIVPYLRLRAVEGTRLPITSVYCGPGSEEDKEAAAMAAGVLLRAKGYRTSLTEVRTSRVPYRPSR
ncbi:DUF2971 domain-containing protein [Modestobacter sp. SYSU DS0875]